MKCSKRLKYYLKICNSTLQLLKINVNKMIKSTSKITEQHKANNEVQGRTCSYTSVDRAPSSLSVSAAAEYMLSLPVTCPPSPALSNVTLTPGRTRNLDQDMEALRLSRQDNPFIQQVLASRESLDCLEESESDDTILMSQEFLSDFDADPLTLPEVHEHMIRSPPPTTWPKSPNFKAFRFPNTTASDDENENIPQKSPQRSRLSLGDTSSQAMTMTTVSSPRPIPQIPRPHSHHQHTDTNTNTKFLLLNPVSIRSLSDVRRISTTHQTQEDDSIQLMSSSDE